MLNRKEAIEMIIKDITVKHQTVPLLVPFKTALRTATEIDSISVEIQLENGIKGKGAASPTYVITGDSLEGIQAALQGPIKLALIGEDIRHFQKLLKKFKAAVFTIQVLKQLLISLCMMPIQSFLTFLYMLSWAISSLSLRV